MPKQKGDDWRGADPPTTPLQRNAFLDRCTAWLVAEPRSTDVEDAIECRTTNPHSRQRDAHHLSMTLREVQSTRQTCFVCGGTEKLQRVTANPFTQRCMVTVCATHLSP